MSDLVLRSDRLILTPLKADDVSDAYVGWLADPRINRFLETRHIPQTAEDCRAFVTACEADPHSHLFGIVRTDENRHIGNIKLGPINPHHSAGAVSLLIGDRGSHGKGFATEAIGTLTDWALGPRGLARAEAGCYEENLGSLRAFLKCGYAVEGFFRSARVSDGGARTGMFWMAKLS